MDTPKFALWCIVEVMGRLRLAGYVTEQVIAGQGFIRVDVPETKRQPAFSRLIGPGSIYSITPVSEETAKACANAWGEAPLAVYEMSQVLAKLPKPPQGNPFGDDEEDT